MPLTRYQIRDEYSLADPELYKAADKDDPEALLEGVAMAGLVGVLRQLGDLAEFAAEIFHDLHEEVMATAARGHSLTVRVQQLEADFPCIEKSFLSQTSHSSLFYSPGCEWHPNMHMDQNLISQGDMPRFVMDSYEESRGPPRLFLLDKFDVAGAGACLKRYTDPSFFKVDSSSSKITNAELHRDKRTRKAKKKASRWRNRETPEVQPTSHAKLHQLFLEESVESHINNPLCRIKLKRRLNEFPFDSKINGSYMGKFLETLTPNHEVDRDIIIDSKPMKLPAHITGDSRIKIMDISSVASDEELLQIMGNPCSSSDAEDNGRELSTNELKEDSHYEFIEASKLNCISESDDRLSQLHNEVNEKEVEVDRQSKLEGSFDGYPSDDIASEVDNYMDALTTMDSEIETDNEVRAKNGVHSLNSGNPGMDSDENEDENDSQPQHSDSKSVGNSTGTDEANSDPRNDLLHSDSLSNLAEGTLFCGDVSGEIVPPGEMYNTPTVNMVSVPVYEESQFAESGVCIEEDDTQRYDSEFGNPSCAGSLTESTPVLLPVGSRQSLSGDASVDQELDEVSSNCKESGAACVDVLGMRTDLGHCVPCKSNDSDCSSQTRDDFLLELSSEIHSINYSGDEGPRILANASLHHSNLSDLAPGEGTDNLSGAVFQVERVEDVCSQNALVSSMNSMHSVALQTEEEQHLVLPETCYLDKGSPNGRVPEVDDSPLFPADMVVSSSSVVSSPEAMDITNQQLAEKAENVIPTDSEELKFAYWGGKNLAGASSGLDDETCRFSRDMDGVVKVDAGLDISSDLCKSPDSPSLPNVHHDNVVTDGIHSESIAFSTVASTHSDVEEDAEEELSAGSPKLQEDAVSRHQDSQQSGVEIKGTSFPDHQESRILNDAHQKPALSDLVSDLDSADHSDYVTTQRSLSACPPKLVEECSSIVQDMHLNGSEINEANLPMNDREPVLPSTPSDSKFGDCVPSTSGIEPSSNEQHQDLELNSSQQLSVADNAVTSPSDHITEPKLTSKEPVELQDAQFDSGSWHEEEVSESESKINVTDSYTQLKFPAEEVVELQDAHFDEKSSHEQEASESESTQQVSFTDSNTEPKFPSEQVVELRDTHFDVESWHEQKIPESESTQPISVAESKEKGVALATSTLEPRFTELNEFQEQKFDVNSRHDDNVNSEPIHPEGKVHCPSYFDEERSTDVRSDPSAAAYLSTEPLVFGHFDSKEQSKDASISVGSFSLLSDVSHIELDEMPPLPPLPPMQWRMGKGQNATSTSGRGLSGHNLSFSTDEQVQVGRLQVEPNLTSCSENQNLQHGHEDVLGNLGPSSPSLQVADIIDHKSSAGNGFPGFGRSQFTNPFLVQPTSDGENSEYGYFVSGGEATKHSEDVAHNSGFLQEKVAQPQVNQLDGETSSEVEKPREIDIISGEGKGENSPDATSSPITTIEEDHVQDSLSTSEGQNVWSMGMSYPFPSHGDGIPNGNKHMKLPRPRSPLIDAVAAHDKSKLRKVTERVRPRIGQEVEERDSLLEQIRAKSFNLKPAIVTRPSIQGPKTNLRVAAILEKANAIRQALAGSDDDEDDDADSWGDS